MKTPLIIFLVGLTGLLGADYFNQVRPMTALQAAPNDYPGVKTYIAQVEKAVDVTQSPIIERSLSFGYLDDVFVAPGFHITHDTKLGKEVLVKAPEAAFEFLTLSFRNGRFSPDFDRPVRLKQPVEIRLNLNRHGSTFFKFHISPTYGGRSIFKPDFFTKGPLKFKVIHLDNLPDHDIEVDCNKLLLTAVKNVEHLRGSTELLEILYRGTKEAYNPAFDAPNLERKTTERTQVFFDF